MCFYKKIYLSECAPPPSYHCQMKILIIFSWRNGCVWIQHRVYKSDPGSWEENFSCSYPQNLVREIRSSCKRYILYSGTYLIQNSSLRPRPSPFFSNFKKLSYFNALCHFKSQLWKHVHFGGQTIKLYFTKALKLRRKIVLYFFEKVYNEERFKTFGFSTKPFYKFKSYVSQFNTNCSR